MDKKSNDRAKGSEMGNTYLCNSETELIDGNIIYKQIKMTTSLSIPSKNSFFIERGES